VRPMNRTPWLAAITVAAAGLASAEVPPTIAKQLINIGRGVCVPETTQIYRPLHAGPPYKGVTIARDISFGPDPMNVLDVFSAEKGGGSRPVLIYVSGGAGNKLANGPEGVFYDNIMLWATKNGMVGVNMQRRAGQAWDDPAKDIAKVVQWVSQNISKYKGNPGRVFMWAQSAGNVPTSTYIGHPEFYGPKGVGVKGVVFMSAPNFNILPATPPPVQAGAGGGFGACGQPDGCQCCDGDGDAAASARGHDCGPSVVQARGPPVLAGRTVVCRAPVLVGTLGRPAGLPRAAVPLGASFTFGGPYQVPCAEGQRVPSSRKPPGPEGS